MLEKPEIRDLRAVLALVTEKSFVGAAAKLGLTQPAISARVSKLEKSFGFPFFHRRPDGISLTLEGKSILPLVSNIDNEFSKIERMAAYWQRANDAAIRIQIDGSMASRALRSDPQLSDLLGEKAVWDILDEDADWTESLVGYGADLVLAGSFHTEPCSALIRTLPMTQESGLCTIWNPSIHRLNKERFSFPDVLSRTVILPSEAMIPGFRKFIINWCEIAYNNSLTRVISVNTESAALESCRQGIGILIMPGEANSRLAPSGCNLESKVSFQDLLPSAYTYGVRYRAEERNPNVMAVVDWFQSLYQR